MLSRFRDRVGLLKRALAWPFLAAGASPAWVGAFGVAVAILAAVSTRHGYYQLAFWLAGLALATDMADGEVARATGTTSPEGNYLDALGDRSRECILLLGLSPFAPDLVALAIVGACLTSFAKARCALVVLMDNRDWPGFGDHPDRGVLILVSYLCAPNSAVPLSLLVLVSWLCFWRRARHARAMIRAASIEELQPYLRDSSVYQR